MYSTWYIDIRILPSMVSGIPSALGLSTRMSSSLYLCGLFWAPCSAPQTQTNGSCRSSENRGMKPNCNSRPLQQVTSALLSLHPPHMPPDFQPLQKETHNFPKPLRLRPISQKGKLFLEERYPSTLKEPATKPLSPEAGWLKRCVLYFRPPQKKHMPLAERGCRPLALGYYRHFL